MKLNTWGFLVCIVFVIGLFGPWLSRGSQPFSAINPKTGQGELRYHRILKLSPFHALIIEDEQIVKRILFVSPGTTLSGIMLLSVALLSTLKFEGIRINFFQFLTAVGGIIVFFMSLGTGQALGLKTQLEWGVMVSLIGVALTLGVSLKKLMEQSSIKI